MNLRKSEHNYPTAFLKRSGLQTLKLKGENILIKGGIRLSKKVAIFDIESVLLDAEFLPLLAERVGKKKFVHEITLKGIRGEIKWEDGLRQRIEALKGVKQEVAAEIAESMPYMKGAHEVCEELKRRGYMLIGVTGGFTIFADRVKRELGFDHIFANQLAFNNGKLVGVEPLKVKSDSVDGLEKLLVKLRVKKDDVVTVVDGANDMKLFRYASVKIAFNAQPIVKEVSNVVVDEKDLTKILENI
jgi:phosphoserine phosphatase